MDGYSTALNVSDGIKLFVKSDADRKLVVFKYKDMDGKTCEHGFLASNSEDAVKVVKNILVQLKQVSNALVTAELENAIEKAVT